jgi:hypothetical protein
MLIGSSLSAASFQNLGFDTTAFPNTIPSPFPGPSFDGAPREWVIPGWNEPHGSVGYNQSQTFGNGASILDVNFRDTHFGLNAPAPVVGGFALGVWPSAYGTDPFTLSQTGAVPTDAKSLQFLYQGDNLKVYVGGSLEPLHVIGTRPTDNPAAPSANYFAVDVTAMAGRTAELRFEFRSYGFDDFSGAPRLFGQPNAQMHVLDDLQFSSASAVPEPATYALLGLGAALLWWPLRRR